MNALIDELIAVTVQKLNVVTSKSRKTILLKELDLLLEMRES